jgi:Fe-S cluster biogenesis protein NfuA/nitrite reductase/ring-hydroxylating ferredoxin subunit
MVVPETTAAGSAHALPQDPVERLQELLARVGSIDDAPAREAAEELVSTLMELYGEGLHRIVVALEEAGPEAHGIRDALMEDGVVASLLLIHGLFPVDLRTRVEEALDRVRPYMRSHGGNVDLVSLEGDVARLRLEGSCDGCPASVSTLELAVKQALEEAAPDLLGIEVEGLVEAAAAPSIRRPLPLVSEEPQRSGWTDVEGLSEVASGTMRSIVVAGTRVLVARVGGVLLAYRDSCAGCGSPLAPGALRDGVLACPSCERRFELPLAGRVVGHEESLQLKPIPLLAENGTVKLALA